MSASLPLRSDVILGAGRAAGFTVSTPAFPASGVPVTNTNQFSIGVLTLTAGTSTSWTLTDNFGTVQVISVAVSVGFLCILPPGWSISIAYTVAPTWRWMGI